jgi:hypothetical protein
MGRSGSRLEKSEFLHFGWQSCEVYRLPLISHSYSTSLGYRLLIGKIQEWPHFPVWGFRFIKLKYGSSAAAKSGSYEV